MTTHTHRETLKMHARELEWCGFVDSSCKGCARLVPGVRRSEPLWQSLLKRQYKSSRALMRPVAPLASPFVEEEEPVHTSKKQSETEKKNRPPHFSKEEKTMIRGVYLDIWWGFVPRPQSGKVMTLEQLEKKMESKAFVTQANSQPFQ